MNKMEREVILNKIDTTCEIFLRKQGGAFACKKCPLYENGLCDKIYNDKNATDEEIMEAYNIFYSEKMSILLGTCNAWDIIRGMTEKDFEDFKEFLYDKYASMCSINDLISEFSNDELIHRYKVFKGVEEDV